MIIYNVTVGVDKSIEAEWLVWMKEVHIPEVMRTGMFLHSKMYRVLTVENEETVSYAIQYSARSLTEIDIYLEKFAPTLRDEVTRKFADKALSFRTLLEEI